MTLNIEVIKPTIGAIIHDVDLNTADENTTQQIQQALLDHHVIFFRNQQLAPQAQAELARGFGSLHIHPIYPSLIMCLKSLYWIVGNRTYVTMNFGTPM
jgi:taurine dioxygenase